MTGRLTGRTSDGGWRFRGFELPEGTTQADAECAITIATALSWRHGWGHQRCGTEQLMYLAQALRAMGLRPEES